MHGAQEPLVLLRKALALAAEDAVLPDLLPSADSVVAVHVASWAYDGLARRVADAIGARPAHCEDTGLGGHLPVRLLDRAAQRIWSGESSVTLLVGGEAQASVSLLRKAGVDPVGDLGWSSEPGGPPAFDLDQLGSAAMQASGLMAPTRVYPLFENRLQADLGLTPAEAHAESARLYAALSRVAAEHPVAWNAEELTPEQVGEAAPGNRMVCEPYPLSMNAMPHVDMAAALVLMSTGAAREHGVPESAMVHVWGGAGADGSTDVLARQGFGSVPALGDALDRCLALAGLTVPELDLVDVYSCFPVVPKLVAQHLGLPRDATLSVTGGHSSFGGPLNSYSLHALATMTHRLRSSPGRGLVHGNGGYLTSQHAVVLSSDEHPDGYVGEPEPRDLAGTPVVVVDPAQAAGADGVLDMVVETATVEHDRAGEPAQAYVLGRTAGGERTATATPRGDSASAMLLSLTRLPAGARTHVGRTVRLHPHDDGTSALTDPTLERR